MIHYLINDLYNDSFPVIELINDLANDSFPVLKRGKIEITSKQEITTQLAQNNLELIVWAIGWTRICCVMQISSIRRGVSSVRFSLGLGH